MPRRHRKPMRGQLPVRGRRQHVALPFRTATQEAKRSNQCDYSPATNRNAKTFRRLSGAVTMVSRELIVFKSRRIAVMVISRRVRVFGVGLLGWVLLSSGVTAAAEPPTGQTRHRVPGRRPIRRLAGQSWHVVVGQRDPGRLQPGLLQGPRTIPSYQQRETRGVSPGAEPRRRLNLVDRAASPAGRPGRHPGHAPRTHAPGRFPRAARPIFTTRSISPTPTSP